MISKLFTGGQTVSNGTKTILLLAAVTISLVAIAGLGAAATTEMHNDTVTFDNSSNVTVETTWNDSISDPANATASVTFYNATEFEDSGTSATAVVTDEISADAGNTTTTEYTSADGLEDGTDYQLVIEADDTEVESVSVDDGSGLFAGGLLGGGGGSGLIAVAALLGGGYLAKEHEVI